MKTPLALAACVAATAMSNPAVADDIRYEAVWHSGNQPSLHTAPQTLQAFLDSGQQLAESGWHCEDVETTELNGQRVYAGLWKPGTGTNLFEGPMGPIDMRDAIKRHHEAGHHLEDFEVWLTADGGRRYVGLWDGGAVDEILTGPMEEDAFFARGYKETHQFGRRLVDVELFYSQGKLLYNGLFREGSGSNLLSSPRPLAEFEALRDQMLAKKMQLTDFEKVEVNGTEMLVGVWSSGSGESQLSAPLPFIPYFAFSQSQYANGKYAEDFEFDVVRPDRPPEGEPGHEPEHVDTSDLPDLPPGISLTDENYLVLEWTNDSDNPFTMKLPRSWLPPWLPHKENGDPVLPDDFCTLNIREAHAIFWQTPGHPALDVPPFLATPSVSDLGADYYLGGVHFSGPFGGCAGTQTPFQFPTPFTTGGVFEPLENLKLVIEGEGGGAHLDFVQGTYPEAEPQSAFELWEDDSLEKLHALLKVFEDMFKDGEDPENYCEIVGNFWAEVCEETPANCPVTDPVVPECQSF